MVRELGSDRLDSDASRSLYRLNRREEEFRLECKNQIDSRNNQSRRSRLEIVVKKLIDIGGILYLGLYRGKQPVETNY